MPWLRNESIEGCNPIKLKEYLAIGAPIVTTRFRELRPYESLVYGADTDDEFVAQVGRALEERAPGLLSQRRQAVADDSWDHVASRVADVFGVAETR